MAYDPAIPDLDHYVGDDIPAIAANFVALAPLVPHIATLVDLTALQPHIAEILNSRIVDHNLDVTPLPSALYVRLQIGLQLVLMTLVGVDTTVSGAQMFTLPVTFRSNSPKWVLGVGFGGLGSAGAQQSAAAIKALGMTDGTTSTLYVQTDGTGSSNSFPIRVAILGFTGGASA